MACTNKSKIKGFLEEKLPEQEMKTIEKHLENCRDCQKELDKLLNDNINLETEQLEVDDAVLISKIKARIKGVRRITLYGLLGFIIGVFSRFYTRDDFLLTKAVMALPYKLAEFALGIFFSKNTLHPWEGMFYRYAGEMGFFPYHPILDFVATSLTPAIIASFIAVIIGYLFSDKRIFIRRKIINFLLAWLIVFLVWTGVLYGTYGYTLAKIDSLSGVTGMTIYKAEKNSTSWLIRIDQDALREEKYAELVAAISQAEKKGKKMFPQEKNGFELLVDFKGGGQIPIYLEKNTGEMIVHNGDAYQVSPDKMELLNDLPGGGK